MSETPSPGAPPPSLITAVKRLLRPLVRLLVAKGVGIQALLDLLKEVYVEVAVADFPVKGKRQTDSRINLLTGVHRKDVKRLRAQAPEELVAPRSIGLGAQVVAHWLGSPATTNADGEPLPLPRQTDASGGPSFDSLVASISTDVRPRAVLDEWLRLGVASLDKDGKVILNHLAFVPNKGFDEKAFYLGRNVHDHMAAAARNVLGESNPLLERSVHYSNLTPDSAAALQQAAERTGMKALLALNRMALDLAAKDKGRADADRRINFGLYFYKGASSFNNLRPASEDDPSALEE